MKAMLSGPDITPPTEVLTSANVCRLAGITYRQMNHWIKTGLIPGQGRRGTGVPREWTPEQLARVQEIKEGLDKIEDILIEYRLRPFNPRKLHTEDIERRREVAS